MQTGNGRHEAQPEPVAGRRTASLKPIEALEYISELVARNSRTFVGDRNDGPGITLPDVDGHASRFATVLDGIVNKIGHCIEQKVSVARDQHALVADRVELPAFLLGSRIEQFHDLAHDLGKIDGAE